MERSLLFVIIALLVFLPWALGGMKLWAQYTTLILATIAFIVALIPRHYDDRYHAGSNLRLIMWPKLIKFPLFWLGLVYFALIVCQILNPAWSYRSSTQGWWLDSLEYITWLPHGIEGTPFKAMNGWRTLMIHGAGWLMMCALWVGITRRRALLIILISLACNGAVLGCIASAQRITNTNEILWFVPSPNIIWGTFIYRNHGAGWFNLMVPIACGLAAWFQLRSLKNLAKSSPAAVFAFLALMLSVMVVVSHSRGGVIALAAFLVAFFVGYIIQQLTLPAYPHRGFVVGVLSTLFCIFVALGFRELNARETWSRFETISEGDESILARKLATRATIEMWQAAPLLGHGAGSYRYLFPLYQQRYPEIWAVWQWDDKANARGPYGKRFYWEYAHNDPIQGLAELGLLGSGVIALGGVWWLVAIIRRRVFTNPLGLALLFGLAASLVHSCGEFIYHCPAILLTWLALFVISLQWSERDMTRQ